MESAMTPSAIPTQTPAICSRVRGRVVAAGTAACDGVDTTKDVQVEVDVTVDGGVAVLSPMLEVAVDEDRPVELVLGLAVERAFELVVEGDDVVVDSSSPVTTGMFALIEIRAVELDGSGEVAVRTV